MPPGPSGMVGQVVHQNPGAIVLRGFPVLPHTVSVTRLPSKAQRATMESVLRNSAYICFTSLPLPPAPSPTPLCPFALPPLCPFLHPAPHPLSLRPASSAPSFRPGPPLLSAMLQDSTSLVYTCPRQPPAGPDPSCRVGGSALHLGPRGAAGMLSALPLTDPGTGSGLGQELMAFPPLPLHAADYPLLPGDKPVWNLFSLVTHAARAAGQRLSHWQWSPEPHPALVASAGLSFPEHFLAQHTCPGCFCL